MKVSEAYNHVAMLGFEHSLEFVDAFYNALGRALIQVSALRPHIRSVMLNHRPPHNLIDGATYEAVERLEGDICFTADAPRAYYFECDGTGSCYIEKYSEETDKWTVIGMVPLTGEYTLVISVLSQD